jgi:glycosyltransferase involved in cell wall biosynthesis
MSSEPLITVVIPTRNRRAKLAQALDSVLAQTVTDLEAIVVDEASSDDTVAYLEGLGDPRVRIVRHAQPRGVAGARNSGIAAARGRWTSFLDDDDLIAPTKLEAQLLALEVTPGARWACTSTARVDENLRIIGYHRLAQGGDILGALLEGNMVPGSASSVLAETALLRETGGFCEELAASADWEAWIRLGSRAPIATVDEPLAAYRIWPSTSSHAQALEETANARIGELHAELGRAHGASFGREGNERYYARQDLQAGRRFLAARRFGRLALRRPRYMIWAAACLVVPRTWEQTWTRLTDRITAPGWRRSVEDWLAPYRA